jgi:hypothetical protein
MLQLAGALIVDLGLSHTSSARAASLTTESSLDTYAEDIPIPKEPTLEERRALLGLNFLNSVCVFDCGPFRERTQLTHFDRIYTFVKDVNDLPYTNDFTEACLQVLEKTAEYNSDQYVIQLVKMQSIAEEINQALPRHSQDFSSGSSAPVALCLRTLQEKLDSFRMKLPIHLQQNRKLLSSRRLLW